MTVSSRWPGDRRVRGGSRGPRQAGDRGVTTRLRTVMRGQGDENAKWRLPMAGQASAIAQGGLATAADGHEGLYYTTASVRRLVR